MDKTGRIRIGKNLVRILGVREGDPKEKQVLWIPNKIKDKTEFLLFF